MVERKIKQVMAGDGMTLEVTGAKDLVVSTMHGDFNCVRILGITNNWETQTSCIEFLPKDSVTEEVLRQKGYS